MHVRAPGHGGYHRCRYHRRAAAPLALRTARHRPRTGGERVSVKAGLLVRLRSQRARKQSAQRRNACPLVTPVKSCVSRAPADRGGQAHTLRDRRTRRAQHAQLRSGCAARLKPNVRTGLPSAVHGCARRRKGALGAPELAQQLTQRHQVHMSAASLPRRQGAHRGTRSEV